MALGDPYITKLELQSYLQIPLDDPSFDTRLEDARKAASREIEQHTGRQFNKADVASPRRFEIDRQDSVQVDDFYTTSGLVVENIWRGGSYQPFVMDDDYDLYPLDGVVDGLPGWPFYRIEFPMRYLLAGNVTGKIRVTAKWGWEEVPPTIKQSAFMIAAQLYRLAEAPFGVAGSDQFGVVRVKDLPHVEKMLQRFVLDPLKIG